MAMETENVDLHVPNMHQIMYAILFGTGTTTLGLCVDKTINGKHPAPTPKL